MYYNERICDSITDRHGNATTLTYGGTATMADGSTQKLLTKVTDPVGRSIHFTWTNIETTGAPAYRITEVEGPFDASNTAVSGVTYMVDYGYDNLQRLTGVDYGDGETQSYSFDAMGNRTAKSDVVSGTGGGTTSESYSVDAANRLTNRTAGTTSTTVTSDANGNTLTDGTRTNTWDSQNRLVQCVSTSGGGSTSQFVYSSDGVRRRGTVTASDGTKTRTDYVYNGQMMVEEVVQHFSATGTALHSPTTVTYFQGPQGPLYRKSSAVTDPT